MNLTRIVPAAVLLFSALVLALPAHAGSLTRTFVSASGNDTNPCTITQPCATFAQAYVSTAVGGIIAALDPGKYGPLSITGSITVNGNGWAAITAPSAGNGIGLNIGPGDKVALIGLEIDGAGVGRIGIDFGNGGGTLTVQGCTVRNMQGVGLEFSSIVATPKGLAVSNSYFNDNATGIDIFSNGSGVLTASIDHSGFFGSTTGLSEETEANAAAVSTGIVDSVFANNQTAILLSGASENAPANNAFLTRLQALGNGLALAADGTDVAIWLAQSTISGNAHGFTITDPTVINTYGDNNFAANGASTGTLTNVGKN